MTIIIKGWINALIDCTITYLQQNEMEHIVLQILIKIMVYIKQRGKNTWQNVRGLVTCHLFRDVLQTIATCHLTIRETTSTLPTHFINVCQTLRT